MSQFGTCATGCTEQKLELVRAAVCDWLAEIESSTRECAEAFGAVAEQLVHAPPVKDDWERAYRSVQDAARGALRRDRELAAPDIDPAPVEPATTWWCARCGGLDAPQPCLGICVWRTIEWVNQATYAHQHDRALAEQDRARRLRHLVRRIATITARPGQWERGWRALQTQARQALQADHQQ